MKKLIFSALVAVVAVGGALSTNAQLYQLNSTQTIPCTSAPSASCFNQTGISNATDGPNQSTPVIDITNYTYQP